jgi:hypothetical protein
VITASNEADTGKLLSAMTTASTSAGRFGLRHADHLHGAHAVLDPQPARSVLPVKSSAMQPREGMEVVLSGIGG